MDVDIVEGNKSGEDNLQAISAEEDRSKAEANQGTKMDKSIEVPNVWDKQVAALKPMMEAEQDVS